MKLNEYREIIKKYEKKYELELEKNKKEYIECMHNYNKESFKNITLNHQKIIRELILDIITEFKEFKNKMKNSPEKVHLNICSISMLHKLDKDAEVYDEVFNASIPAILQCIEKHNKEIS